MIFHKLKTLLLNQNIKFVVILIGEQDIMHYVSENTIFNDYIFSLGYYLILQCNGDHETIIPTYNESVIGEEDNVDSQITQVFTRAFQLIYQISQEYVLDKGELV